MKNKILIIILLIINYTNLKCAERDGSQALLDNYLLKDSIIVKGFEILHLEFIDLEKENYDKSIKIIIETANQSRTRLELDRLVVIAPYLRGKILESDLVNICNKKWFCVNLRKRLDVLEKQSSLAKRPRVEREEDLAIVRTACQHCFHQGHLLEHVAKINDKCPICNSIINIQEFLNLGPDHELRDEICVICQEELMPVAKKRRP